MPRQDFQTYLALTRLNRPAGIWLLLWPCWLGTVLASAPSLPPLWWLALFAGGAVLLRSAGCIINDLWDRDIDRRVARTAGRPLASGDVRPRQALILLALLLLAGLGILLQFPPAAIGLGLAAMPLVVLYPLAKRVFFLPQLILGLVFNWGALLAPVALTGFIPLSCWLLYAACVFWTLGYDTLYALQDLEDDRKIGVFSSARWLGRRAPVAIAGCYGMAGFLLMLAASRAGLSVLAVAALALSVLGFGWRILSKTDHASPASCGQAFRANAWLGGAFFLSFLLGLVPVGF